MLILGIQHTGISKMNGQNTSTGKHNAEDIGCMGGINVLCSPNAKAKVTKRQLTRSTKGKPVLWKLAAKHSQQLSPSLLMGADATVAQQSIHNSQKVWFVSDFSTTGIY